MKSVITLLTDFGLQDPFVGQMKGVLYSIHNDIHIIDLSHGIVPHGIKEGAVTIGMCYDYFPPETIHVCVVDPGVGSGRRPIIVAADNHYFVGPDNGIFSAIYKTSQNAKVVHITSEDYFLKKKGATFHARDIFSPVAAWLSRGVAIEKFGIAIHDYMKLDLPQVRKTTEKSIEGEIIYIDHFGNAITNIERNHITTLMKSSPHEAIQVLCAGKQIPLKRFYSDVTDGTLYALINSNDLLEFFIYRGNAAKEHNLKVGEGVGIVM